MKRILKKVLVLTIILVTVMGSLSACGDKKTSEKTEITVFAAKSLNGALDEIIAEYEKLNPNVKIVVSYDSSGTLMEQIRAGAECDVFFSAAQKQMNTLSEESLIVEESRVDVVNNQVCVVTYKDSDTKVTGLMDIGNAKSIALADGSVPVGRYTRVAMVNSGILAGYEEEGAKDPSEIKTEYIAKKLGDKEINECANVGAVKLAVAEKTNEVGTVYYSDIYGYEDKLLVLEIISYELTGDVKYPAAVVKNEKQTEEMKRVSEDFVKYLKSDDAKKIFDKYHFDTDL